MIRYHLPLQHLGLAIVVALVVALVAYRPVSAGMAYISEQSGSFWAAGPKIDVDGSCFDYEGCHAYYYWTYPGDEFSSAYWDIPYGEPYTDYNWEAYIPRQTGPRDAYVRYTVNGTYTSQYVWIDQEAYSGYTEIGSSVYASGNSGSLYLPNTCFADPCAENDQVWWDGTIYHTP